MAFGKGKLMSEKKGCTDPEQGNLLAAYEMGLLAPGDQLRFEKHLSACPTCRAQLLEMAPFMRAVQSDPGHMAGHLVSLSAMDQALGTDASRESGWEAASNARPASRGRGLRGWLDRLRSPRGWPAAWPVAAPLLLGGSILIAAMIQHRSAPDLRRLARPEAAAALEMTAFGELPGEAGKLIEEGLIAYENGRYGPAAESFKAAAHAASRQSREDAAFAERISHQIAASWLYAGLCFLQAQVADSAVACFQRALFTASAAEEDVRWHLAQAHLLRRDAKGAAAQLSILAAESPRYRKSAANQLRAIHRLQAQ
jgi:tetratricopeptide (TPR) repeat protein